MKNRRQEQGPRFRESDLFCAKVRKTDGAWLGRHVYLAAMLPEEYVALFSRPVSKQAVTRLAEHIQRHPKEVEALLSVVEEFRPNVSWRGGWVLATLGEMGFQGPPGYLKRLISIVATTPDATVARCILRSALGMPLHEEAQEGPLVEAALQWLDQASTPLATLHTAGLVMLRVCEKYPDLWHELSPRVERLKQNPAPAIRALVKQVDRTYKKSIAPKLYGSAR